MLKIPYRLVQRLILAGRTLPSQKDWLIAIAILILFALIYLPIGFSLGFLQVQPKFTWHIVLSVIMATFFMPGLVEEGIFRVLLIPHPTESVSAKNLWISVGISWILFMGYHIHPFTPAFFKESAFLIGAGLLGVGCTIAYLQSGSLWTPVVIHWLSVVAWLILLGGLEKFEI
ncbi:MAG: CPBP family glutamic-type intramembrane protease [Leptolyngbyaceae cyanobacterium bins.302]|nr:CPBP family glutamic-type intramembrane protease [Leptolyngbyaceae cyanobacterium bins.302]